MLPPVFDACSEPACLDPFLDPLGWKKISDDPITSRVPFVLKSKIVPGSSPIAIIEFSDTVGQHKWDMTAHLAGLASGSFVSMTPIALSNQSWTPPQLIFASAPQSGVFASSTTVNFQSATAGTVCSELLSNDKWSRTPEFVVAGAQVGITEQSQGLYWNATQSANSIGFAGGGGSEYPARGEGVQLESVPVTAEACGPEKLR